MKSEIQKQKSFLELADKKYFPTLPSRWTNRWETWSIMQHLMVDALCQGFKNVLVACCCYFPSHIGSVQTLVSAASEGSEAIYLTEGRSLCSRQAALGCGAGGNACTRWTIASTLVYWTCVKAKPDPLSAQYDNTFDLVLLSYMAAAIWCSKL